MASSYGGTVETLTSQIVVVNDFGGIDTLTHIGWGLLIDPFVEVPLAAYASTMNAAPVQVIRYLGTAKGVAGQETFSAYPGVVPDVAVITAQDLHDLELAGAYTFQGFVALAKTKLPAPVPVKLPKTGAL